MRQIAASGRNLYATVDSTIVEDLGAFVLPQGLGQWFDGIRFEATASSPTRSRRTWAGLRQSYFSSIP